MKPNTINTIKNTDIKGISASRAKLRTTWVIGFKTKEVYESFVSFVEANDLPLTLEAEAKPSDYGLNAKFSALKEAFIRSAIRDIKGRTLNPKYRGETAKYTRDLEDLSYRFLEGKVEGPALPEKIEVAPKKTKAKKSKAKKRA